MAKQLTPSALAEDTVRIEQIAAEMTDRLVAAGEFDAASELTSPFSVNVVADLVGLPDDGREMIGPLGERAFNTMGPPNARFVDGAQALEQLTQYTMGNAMSGNLCPGTRGRSCECRAMRMR